MGMKQKVVHELCVRNVEDYFMDRVTDLVGEMSIADADALHEEFVVDGIEPEDWLFVNDLTDVQSPCR